MEHALELLWNQQIAHLVKISFADRHLNCMPLIWRVNSAHPSTLGQALDISCNQLTALPVETHTLNPQPGPLSPELSTLNPQP
jgi:hypothetical protein